MRKAGLDELQAGIEIGGRNINNHRCVDDTTLMAESEEDLRSFQESSLTPQFKGINSLAFCLFYSPALTTTCDLWEDHSLDYMDLCRQS